MDTIARGLYAETFSDEGQPPGPVVILQRLVGTDRIRFVNGRSTISRDADGFRVQIERGLSPERTCLRFATACATVGLVRCSGHISPLELRAVALAVVMPRPAITRAVAAYGRRILAIANVFVLDVELVAERLKAAGFALASGQHRRDLLDAG